MTLITATDLAGMIDTRDADTFVRADGSTFLGHLTQGYAESLDLPGRRPVVLALNSAVDDVVAVGDTLDLYSYAWTVQHIEQGQHLSRLFLEVR